MSHRTVYRYFPTKEELILAVAERPTEGVPEFMEPTRFDESRGALRVQWRWFGERLDILRSERMVPGGLELRKARLVRARPAFDRLLEDAGVPAGPSRSTLVELVIHLTSSTTLLELVDRHDMTVEQAADMVLDAVERLVRSHTDDQANDAGELT